MKPSNILDRAYTAFTRKSEKKIHSTQNPIGIEEKVAPTSSPPNILSVFPAPIQISNETTPKQKIEQLISELRKDEMSEKKATKIKNKLIDANKYGKLDLSRQNINNDILIKILPLLSTLNITHLNLGGNNIGDEGAIALADELKTNTSIKELELYVNDIGPAGATAIAKALEENKSLTTLNLNRNKIGPTGATSLAKTLETNTSLTHLNLRCNNSGDTGATALAKALEENKSIKKINLIHNQIGSEGAIALAKVLEENTSLKDLFLGVTT